LSASGRKLLRAATGALIEHLPEASVTVKGIVSLMDDLEHRAAGG